MFLSRIMLLAFEYYNRKLVNKCVKSKVLVEKWTYWPPTGAWTWPSGTTPGQREGERSPWEGASAEREGEGKRAGAREGADAPERRVGEGPDETRREREAEDASSSRCEGEEGGGETKTTLAPQYATQVSEILVGKVSLAKKKKYLDDITGSSTVLQSQSLLYVIKKEFTH